MFDKHVCPARYDIRRLGKVFILVGFIYHMMLFNDFVIHSTCSSMVLKRFQVHVKQYLLFFSVI